MKKLVKLLFTAALAGALVLAPVTGTTVQAATKQTTVATVDTLPALTAKAVVPAYYTQNGYDAFYVEIPVDLFRTLYTLYPVTDLGFEEIQNNAYDNHLDEYKTSAAALQGMNEYIASQATELEDYVYNYNNYGFDATSAAAFGQRFFMNKVMGMNRAVFYLQQQGK